MLKSRGKCNRSRWYQIKSRNKRADAMVKNIGLMKKCGLWEGY